MDGSRYDLSGQGDSLRPGDVSQALMQFQIEENAERNAAGWGREQQQSPEKSVRNNAFFDHYMELHEEHPDHDGDDDHTEARDEYNQQNDKNHYDDEHKGSLDKEEDGDHSHGFSGFHEFVRSPKKDKINKPSMVVEESDHASDEGKEVDPVGKLSQKFALQHLGGDDGDILNVLHDVEGMAPGSSLGENVNINGPGADGDDDDSVSHSSDNWIIPAEESSGKLDNNFGAVAVTDISDHSSDDVSVDRSEPVVDALAMENTIKNQAMLYESSHQMLQPGGMVGSWNQGGSVESIDPKFAGLGLSGIAPNGSIENMNGLPVGASGSLERDQNRSVSFAEANNVVEFSAQASSGEDGEDHRETGVHSMEPMINRKARLAKGAKALEEDDADFDENVGIIETNKSNSNNSRGGDGGNASSSSRDRERESGSANGNSVGVLAAFEDFQLPFNSGESAAGGDTHTEGNGVGSFGGERGVMFFGTETLESHGLPNFEEEEDPRLSVKGRTPQQQGMSEDRMRAASEELQAEAASALWGSAKGSRSKNISRVRGGFDTPMHQQQAAAARRPLVDTSHSHHHKVDHTSESLLRKSKSMIRIEQQNRENIAKLEKLGVEGKNKDGLYPWHPVGGKGGKSPPIAEGDVSGGRSRSPSPHGPRPHSPASTLFAETGASAFGENDSQNIHGHKNKSTNRAPNMERIERLAEVPASHAVEKAVMPLLATECTNLTFKPIDMLQDGTYLDVDEEDKEGGDSCGAFSLKTDRVRLVIRTVVENREQFDQAVKKLPRVKKSYSRSQVKFDSDTPVDAFVVQDLLFGGRQFVKKDTNELVEPDAPVPERKKRLLSPSIKQRPSSPGDVIGDLGGIPPSVVQNSTAASYVGDAIAKADADAFNRSMISRRVSPFSPLHFLKRYHTGVRCVLVDFHMQFLGTYDVSMTTTYPGLDFEPSKLGNSKLISRSQLNSRYDRSGGQPQPSKTQASVLEIDFSKLPNDVFAVIPLVIDECLTNHEQFDGQSGLGVNAIKALNKKGDIPKVLQNMKFRCDVYQREKIESDEDLEWEGKLEGVPNPHLREQDATRDEIDGVESRDDEENSWLGKAKRKADEKNSSRQKQEIIFSRALYNAANVPKWEEVKDANSGLILNTPTASLLAPVRSGNDIINDPHVQENSPNSPGFKPIGTPGVSFGAGTGGHPYDNNVPNNDGPKGLMDAALWSRHLGLSTRFVRASNHEEKMSRRGSVFGMKKASVSLGGEGKFTRGSDRMMKAFPLGMKEAFLPFVFYRRTTVEKGWSYKVLNAVTKGLQSDSQDHILQTILGAMVLNHVVPYHLMHIEHCRNCEEHAMTTRHTPGMYRAKANELKEHLADVLPQIYVDCNNNTVLSNNKKIREEHSRKGETRQQRQIRMMKENERKGMKTYFKAHDPRVGAFEISLRPYCSTRSYEIYSKLRLNEFPRAKDLNVLLTTLLHPKTYLYDYENPARLSVILFDASTKRQLSDITVTLYSLSVHPTAKNYKAKVEDQESGGMVIMDDDEESDTESEDEDDDSSLSKGKQAKKVQMEMQERFNERTEEEEEPTGPRANSEKYGISTAKTFFLKDRRALKKRVFEDVTVSAVNNAAFQKISSWGKKEVMEWFDSHHANNDVKFFAEMAGVVSGGRLVKLCNEASLVKWGCTNRRVLAAMLTDLERLKVSETETGHVGLSNHRLHHMAEVSRENGKKVDLALMKTRALSEVKGHDSTVATASQTHSALINTDGSYKLMSLERVVEAKTDTSGVLNFAVRLSGSYLVKVGSSEHRNMWSQVMHFDEKSPSKATMWAAAIQAVTVPVRVILSRKIVTFVENFGLYFRGAALVGFTCMRTLRVYLVRVQQYDHDGELLSSGASMFPIGRYICHVDGSIVNVKRPRRLLDMTTAPDIVQLDFSNNEDRVCRQHNVLVRNAVKTLQMSREHIRRSRARKSLNMLGMGMRIRIKLKRLLKRARERLLPRRVTRIQATWRGYAKRKIHLRVMARVVMIQCLLRGGIIRLRRKRARCSYILFKFYGKIMRKVHHRRFIKSRKAAIMIESIVRGFMARRKVAMIRKMRAVSNTTIMVFKLKLRMKILRRRRQKENWYIEREAEKAERGFMDFEDFYVRDFLKQEEEERQRQIVYAKKVTAELARQEKMRVMAAEHKIKAAAIVIQSVGRGFSTRLNLDKHVLRITSNQQKAAAGAAKAIARTPNRRMSNAALSGYQNMSVKATKEEKQRLQAQVTAALRFRQARGFISKEDMRLLEEQERREQHEGLMSQSPLRRTLRVAREAPTVALQVATDAWSRMRSRNLQKAAEAGRRRQSMANAGLLMHDPYDTADIDEGAKAELKAQARHSMLLRKDKLLERWKELHPNQELPEYLEDSSEDDGIDEEEEESSNEDEEVEEDSGEEEEPEELTVRAKFVANLREKGQAAYAASAHGAKALLTSSRRAVQVARSESSKMPGRLRAVVFRRREKKKLLAAVKMQSAWRGIKARKGILERAEARDKLARMVARHEEGSSPEASKALGGGGSTLSQMIAANKGIAGQLQRGVVLMEEGSSDGESSTASPVAANREFSKGVANKPAFVRNLSVSVEKEAGAGEKEQQQQQQAALLTKQQQPKRVLALASPTSASVLASKALSTSLSALATGGSKALSITKSGLTAAAGAVKASGEAYMEKQRRAADRMYRRQNSITGLRDALLHIAGSLSHLPLVDRQWYVGVFPRGTTLREGGIFNLVGSNGATLGPPASSSSISHSAADNEAYNQTRERLGDRVSKKDLFEHAQSHTGYPLSPQAFSHLSFHVHLTDVDRYQDMEIVVFLESLGSVYTPSAANKGKDKLTSKVGGGKSSPKAGADSSDGTIIKAEGAADADSVAMRKANSFFVPAFYGVVPVDRGASFGPAGGRAHIKLRPTDEIAKLPKAKQLLQLDGLAVVVSLLPVALPPSSLLQTFRGVSRAQPCYPSTLVEGSLVAPSKINTAPLQSAVMAMGSFRDLVIVSTRHQGATPGALVYDSGGAYLGPLATTGSEKLGNITVVVGGIDHVCCCSSNGTVMVVARVQDRYRNSTATHSDQPSHWSAPNFIHVSGGARFGASGTPAGTPNSRSNAVVAACMASHAGLDLLFAADRAGRISVSLLDKGLPLRHFTNDLLPLNKREVEQGMQLQDKGRIVAMCVVSTSARLYVARESGTVTVIGLFDMLEGGRIEEGGKLANHILSDEVVFRQQFDQDSGNRVPSITSMCCVCPNEFLGLHNEDEDTHAYHSDGQGRVQARSRSRRGVGQSDAAADGVLPLEGHIILVGGGDAEPVVKVLQPQTRGIRLLSILRGHGRAVTELASDAAGRYFFSGSSSDRAVVVWDGLTFRPHNVFSDVSVGALALAPDALLLSSFKPPYLQMWKVKQYSGVNPVQSPTGSWTAYGKAVLASIYPTLADAVGESIDPAGANTKKGDKPPLPKSIQSEQRLRGYADAWARLQHEAVSTPVVTARTPQWCFEKLRGDPVHGFGPGGTTAKGGVLAAASSLQKPKYVDEREEAEVVARWLAQYHRQEAIPDFFSSAAAGPTAAPASASGALAVIRGSNQHDSKTKKTPMRSETPRARARREQDVQRLAREKELQNYSPGQKASRRRMESPDLGGSEGPASPESPPFSLSPSPAKQQSAGFDGGDEEDDDDYGAYDDRRYNELFPGKALRRDSDEEDEDLEEEDDEELNQRSPERQRQLWRRNHHPHMSDSDDEEGERVRYLKTRTLTKAERRAEALKKREEQAKKRKEKKRRAHAVGLPYDSDEDETENRNSHSLGHRVAGNAIGRAFVRKMNKHTANKKTKEQLEQEAFKDTFIKNLHDDDDSSIEFTPRREEDELTLAESIATGNN
jgi:hypothetical protein